MRRLTSTEGVLRQQRMRQVVRIHQLSIELAVATDATEARATEVYAVIRARAADELGFTGLAFHAPIGTRHLQRGVGSVRAGVDEKRMVQAVGGQGRQPIGQLECQRLGKLERR